MSFRELVALFLRFCEKNRAKRTADFYRERLSPVVKVHGELAAAELRHWHLLEFKHTWHLVMAVQRLYRWAVEEQGLLEANPVLKLRRPRLRSRRRVLVRHEVLRMMRLALADFRRVILMARETAARPQELRTVTWEMICWRDQAATLEAALTAGNAYFSLAEYKGRSFRSDPSAPRVIPISARLGRMLCRLPARRGLVLLSAAGNAWNRNSLRCRMRRLRVRAGLGKDAAGENVVLYSLRHSTATELVADGFETSAMQHLLGHAHVSTTARYIHLHKRHLLEAWRRFKSDRKRKGDEEK